MHTELGMESWLESGSGVLWHMPLYGWSHVEFFLSMLCAVKCSWVLYFSYLLVCSFDYFTLLYHCAH